jgi:threonine dehydratase
MNLDAIQRAEPIVRRYFPPTPMLEARRLTKIFSREVRLKLDCFTPIRAFKLRGALVKMDALQKAGAEGGVVTASAGNHGLAVAWAARAFGRPALVVVPENANPQKVEAIESEGAEVIRHGLDYQSAADRSAQIAQDKKWHFVHAYDDSDIITGQGTLGLEIDASDLVLAGIGGGGLIAGLSIALKARFPAIKVVGVQPRGADSMARSIEENRIATLSRVDTIADGLGARRPGELTFDVVRKNVDRVLRVSDEDLVKAVELLMREERIIAEPAGVAGLAGLMRYPELAEPRVTLIISGANISDELLFRVTHQPPGRSNGHAAL